MTDAAVTPISAYRLPALLMAECLELEDLPKMEHPPAGLGRGVPIQEADSPSREAAHAA